MSRVNIKVNKWRKKHKELFNFLDNKKATGEEIRTWISDCVAYFTEIKMQPNIITYFIERFDYYDKIVELENNEKILAPIYEGYHDNRKKTKHEIGIGPFPFDGDGYIIKDNNNRLSPKFANKGQMTMISVAFKVAEKLIDDYEDEERIIPKYILNEFNTTKNQKIYISLKSIQESYEKRSSKNILAPIITTTELVCKLIPELDNQKELSKKINKLYSDKLIYEKYKIDKEVIWALNNSRIIRNCDIHYPQKENNTTMFEAVSYCHILILFITGIISSGEIK